MELLVRKALWWVNVLLLVALVYALLTATILAR